ncbi:sensor histidine kinase [Vitreimonas flagellata]|uniref:sensor histidine kinase n=1 Tax=Vitreimonas flagellata TaxID=2560861 RepID=UPI00107531C9|nr:sensor histidine kinase [Vitreimonas flagellata]
MRDEFSPQVRRLLEQRAGHRCSFPGCDAETSGPSKEPQGVAKTGMACHIFSASGGPGARRVNANLTPQERAAYENGIWLCNTHGTLIDRDEVRFSAPLLCQWRDAAVRRAAIRQASGSVSNAEFDLFEHEITVTHSNLQETTVGQGFIDAGAPVFWGPLSDAVRDFVFEVVQNALTHGGASRATVTFKPKSITVRDDGAAFDPSALPTMPNTRGGGLAFQALVRRGGDRLTMLFTHAKDGNEYKLQFLRTRSDLTQHSPCAIDFTWDTDRGLLHPHVAERARDCSTLFVAVPDYMSFSRSMLLGDRLASWVGGRQVIFVGRSISQDVQEQLTRDVPDRRFLNLSGEDVDFYD